MGRGILSGLHNVHIFETRPTKSKPLKSDRALNLLRKGWGRLRCVCLQIIDLKDQTLKPENWHSERPPDNPNYQHPADMAVYELHIRDFSISDPQVPDEHRGKYTAFSQSGLGAKHLQELQKAGMTHVHLLPSYDFGSVPEKRKDQSVIEVGSSS